MIYQEKYLVNFSYIVQKQFTILAKTFLIVKQVFQPIKSEKDHWQMSEILKSIQRALDTLYGGQFTL